MRPIVLLLLLLTAGALQASEWQSLASIRLQAERFLDRYPYDTGYPPVIELGRLDPRLRLRACAEDLVIGFTRPERDRGSSSLTIRCTTPVGWKLHLPVTVRLFDDVLVTRTPVSRGAAIEPERLVTRKQEVSRFSGGYYRPGDPVDRLQARRDLPAGTAITARNVEPRLAVRSGELVTIRLSIRGLDIKSRGKALQSGPVGKIIRVRNAGSGRVVEGEITAPGQVRVRM
jgi:flagella basal body P-ring formation protein FlgA